jgi:hypothetical protein
MLKNLIKIAADLDSAGFKMEADIVDVIIRRVASELGEGEGYDSDAGDSVPSAEISEEDFASLVDSLGGLSEDEDEEDEGLDDESFEEWIAREEEAGRR